MRTFCSLCIILALLIGLCSFTSCSGPEKVTCNCPTQIKSFAGTSQANEWLNKQPANVEIVDIQYETSGQYVITTWCMISYINHTCK